MDRKDYAKWVDYVLNNGLKPPRILIENYDSWMCKLTLARFLSRRGCQQYVPAIELLEIVLKETMTDFKEDDDITYEEFIEHKAWLLKDLAVLYWITEKDAVKALSYAEKSLKIAESVEYSFMFISRGEIWDVKLNLLMEAKGEEATIHEIENKLQEFKYWGTSKTNSYLFYGYYTLANIERKKENWKSAVDYLKKALGYFPLEENAKVELDEMWQQREDNLIRTFEYMEKLTFCQVSWDI